MDKVEQIPTEQVFGIAKRMTLELEKFPLQTQAAVCGMMRLMLDHRQITLQSEAQQAEVKAREEAMADARRQHAAAAARQQEEEAERLKKQIARAEREAQQEQADTDKKLVLVGE